MEPQKLVHTDYPMCSRGTNSNQLLPRVGGTTNLGMTGEHLGETPASEQEKLTHLPSGGEKKDFQNDQESDGVDKLWI